MYYLNNFCSLCLAPNKNVTSVISINPSAKEILQYLFPDYILQKPEIPKQICGVCLNSLNNIFIFKQRCLRNIITFSEYVQKLIVEYGLNKYMSVSVTDIAHDKSKNHNVESTKSPNLTKEIKRELVETNENDSSVTENQNDALNFDNIESVSIKIESSVDDFFANEGSEDVAMRDDPFECMPENSMEKTDEQQEFSYNADSPLVIEDDDGDDTNKNDNYGEMEEESNLSSLASLPEKSKKRYELTYSAFKLWCSTRNIKSTTEDVMLEYFLDRSNVMKSPSSLWCEYSMLKSTIFLNESIDISKHSKLKTFLKSKNVGYRPKKALIFTREDIIKFVTEAPDDIYLMKKVVAIMGIAGACRKNELCKMTTDNIEDKGSIIIVRIPNSRNNMPRSFSIVNDEKENFFCLDLCRKYFSLRPKDMESKRLFLKYHNGRCVRQVVGINTFGKIPCEIAKFLKLENAQAYTGNSFRRTSVTLLANTGIDILDLKRYGSWKFSTGAEGSDNNH